MLSQALLIVMLFTVNSQQVITARGRVPNGVRPASIWPPASHDDGMHSSAAAASDVFGNSLTARGQNASDMPGHYTITPNQRNNSALIDSFQKDLFAMVPENTVYASMCPGLGVLFWFANLTSSQAQQLQDKGHNVILHSHFSSLYDPVQLILFPFSFFLRRLHSRHDRLFHPAI